MGQLREQVGTFTPDNLFYDTLFPMQTGAVKLAAGQGLVLRGTIIGKKANGEYAVASKTAETPIAADVILADDIDTGDAAGTAIVVETYISGSFNSNALITDGTDGVAVHADVLRTKGIYIKAAL